MNSFKLGMNHSNFNKRRYEILLMNKQFQISERNIHIWNRGRNKSRCVKRTTCWPNPVLRCSKFTRIFIGTACVVNQPSMNIPNQAQTKRKTRQLFKAPIHSVNIVNYLFHIIVTLVICLVILCTQDIYK